MDIVGGLHFFVCGHLGIYSFLLAGLPLRFQVAEISRGNYSQTRSSVPVANKLMNSLMAK